MAGLIDRIKARFARETPENPEKPPVGELGRATSDWLLQYLATHSYNPDDLITKKGWDLYDKMQNDSQVKAALETKKYAVLCKKWQIEAASDSPQDKAVAEFVEWNLATVGESILGVLYNTLDAFAKGYSIGEKIWEIVPSGKYAGKIRLAKVKSKDPSAYSFDLDEFYNIRQLLLTVEGSTVLQQPVPLSKFLVYSNRPKYGMPWGQSDLRSVYRHWWCKDYLIKWWQLFTEKYAMPTIVGYYKSGIPPERQSDLLDLLHKIASDTAIIVPEEVSEQIKEIFTNRDPRMMYEAAVSYHDTQIAIGILGESLTLQAPGKQSSASFAMASVHQDTLFAQLNHIKNDLEEITNRSIVKPLVQYNFGNVEPPMFAFEPLREKDMTTIADVFWKLMQVGAISPEEGWVRRYLGFPPKEDGVRSLQELDAQAGGRVLRGEADGEMINEQTRGRTPGDGNSGVR